MSTKEESVAVTPFAVEARTPRNQDVMIQNLGRMRLRGAVSSSVEVYDKQWESEDGSEEIPTRPASAKLIDGIAETPGMILYINPASREWKVVDPMYDDEKKLSRIAKAMKRALGMINVGEKLQGIAPKSGKLGPDEMKSLCKEVVCLVEASEMKVVKGIAPSMEDVDQLPGRYLLNWSNLNQWKQPRYEDEYDNWVNRMGQISGE